MWKQRVHIAFSFILIISHVDFWDYWYFGILSETARVQFRVCHSINWCAKSHKVHAPLCSAHVIDHKWFTKWIKLKDFAFSNMDQKAFKVSTYLQGTQRSLLRSKLNSTKTQWLSSGNIVIIHMTCWSKVTLKSLLKSQTSNKAYGNNVRRK